ncbi:hypothetical protein [Clostridium transplantifaecale]|uniref:hypothetical protein n=1 Tax=Clostridium transplantifaecale TaxID=2479838 RepID=UPI0013DD9600|nr:hypothetical protein [Clostridium transplantifaecale]
MTDEDEFKYGRIQENAVIIKRGENKARFLRACGGRTAAGEENYIVDFLTDVCYAL